MRSRRDVVRAMLSASAVGLVPLNGWGHPREGVQATDVPLSIRGSVRERIRQGLANGESTGLALSVVSGDQIVWEAGFGWADRAKGLKVTPHDGEAIQEVKPGDVVFFEPQEKHWRGSSAQIGMTHIAITESVDGKAVDWLEPVSDKDYGK